MAWPSGDWQRYRGEAFLGEGGMGRVFKAWDPRLRRHVAIKFLNRSNPEATLRFLREARAQASVEHPNVCQVFETGEVDGAPYIVMQLVDGASLQELVGRLETDHVVRLILSVAEAVAAAHRHGLIHRDLKPSNILVQADGDERHPVVLDFGLARPIGTGPIEEDGATVFVARAEDGDAGEVELTVDGKILGSPAYMAPEQILDGSASLDVRTDIYGLGVTMYELLTSNRPFSAPSTAALMVQKIETEPRPVGSHEREIPAELQAIVGRCIERDPDDRYQSASELADDLSAYLEGRPVSAFAGGPVYRARKWVARHRWISVAAALALTVCTVATGLWIDSRRAAAIRETAATRFGQEVARIETILWKSRTVPLHDTRPQKEAVRRRIGDITRQMDELGDDALGPGHFAIGRAHLALGDDRTARRHLERAWAAGTTSPEVAYALGSCFTAAYAREVELLTTIASPSLRLRRQREIDAELRAPALHWLGLARGSDAEAPELIEGSIAFYEGETERARELAATAFDRIPWLYEAKVLVGDIDASLAMGLVIHGEPEAGAARYAAAEASYREAARLAPSDAMVLSKVADAVLGRAEALMGLESPEVEGLFESALAILDRAATADSELFDVHLTRLEVEHVRGVDLGHKNGDWRSAFAAAQEAGQRALELSPDDATVLTRLGDSTAWAGQFTSMAGEDPGPIFERAIGFFERAVEQAPSYAAFNNLGVALRQKAAHHAARGEDSRDTLRRATSAFERAIELDPVHEFAWSNLGRVLHDRGRQLASAGEDPDALYERAVETFRSAIDVDQKQPILFNNMGNVLTDRATSAIASGTDPLPFLEQARDAFETAIALRPEYVFAHNNLASLLVTWAEFLVSGGRDPEAQLVRAEIHLDRALEIRPAYASPHFNRGTIHMVRAGVACREGRDPRVHLDAARRSFSKGLEWRPKIAEVEADLALTAWHAARWEAANGHVPARNVERGLAAAARALAINPNSARASAVGERLRRLAGGQRPLSPVRPDVARWLDIGCGGD